MKVGEEKALTIEKYYAVLCHQPDYLDHSIR